VAENEGNRGTISTQRLPATAAPTRSQANEDSRAPGPGKLLIDQARKAYPQPAAKPPPGDSVERLLRLINATSAVVETPAPCPRLRPDSPEEAPKHERRWKLLKFAAQCLLVLTCIIIGMVTQQSLDHAIVLPLVSPAVQPPPPETKPLKDALPDDPGAALTTALDDLDHALFDFPGKTPEQLLKSVSRPGEDCALAWSGHYPSLVFGKQPIRNNSLSATLEGCARAVESLPK